MSAATRPRQLGTARRPTLDGRWITVAIIVAAIWSAHGTGASPAVFFEPGTARAVGNFIANVFPPDLSAEFLSSSVGLAVQTVQISILGTLLAIVLGFPLAIVATRQRGEDVGREALGTRAWVARWSLYYIARGVLNLLRAIPELLWALFFVVAVGLGAFAGVLALAAHGTGVLGKLYAELFETVDQRLVETGRATGASDLGVLVFVRLPATAPVLLSYTFFRWECNMRAATLLGFVGAGGLGSQLIISMRLYQYDQVLTLTIAILLLVTLVDVFAQIVRTRLLDVRSVVSAPLAAGAE